MRFVLFANPKARLFRDDEGALDALYKVTSSRGLLLTPKTPAELQAELANLLDDRPEFLVVAGGDGTVSRFTTALLRVFGEDAPPVAVLHAGTMNTIGKSLGGRGEPVKQLQALLDGTPVRARRWPLRVGEDRYGWLFGTGVIPRYIQVYEEAGATSPKEAAKTLARLSFEAFRGGAPDVFVRERIDVLVDGRVLPLKEWMIVAAAGVDDMGLRFRPFTSVLDAPGKMGIFATASRPWRFVMDLPLFRLGREAHHSLAFHELGEELVLRATEPLLYNLDGEVERAAGNELPVRVGPPVTFLLPPGSKPPRNTLDD